MKQVKKPKANGCPNPFRNRPQSKAQLSQSETPNTLENTDALINRSMRYLHLVGQDLERRCITPSRNVEKFFVTQAISPFEFYMVYEADKTGPFVTSEENTVMQNFYNKNEDFNSKYDVKNVEPFKCYVVRDKSTGIWMRVRVLTYDAVTHKAFVYYCDTSEKQHVQCNALRDLHKEFLNQPMPVFRCHLHGIAPVDRDYYWPLETLQIFSEFAFKKSFLALTMTWTNTPVCGSVDVIYDLGVLLFEPDSLQCSVNSYFVQEKLAVCIGFSAAYPTMMSESYSDKTKCVLLANGTEGTELPSKMETINKNSLLAIDDAVPKFVREQLVNITIANIRGVDDIFVHLESKEKELRQMEKELAKEYEEFRTKSTELKLGDFVCCVTLVGKHKNYCRGVISKILPTQDIGVILVDHGNEVTTHFDMISLLSERFLSTPSFVTRLHLYSTRPLPLIQKSWSKEANLSFRNFIMQHAEDHPYYFAYRPETSDVVNYEDIRQRMKYDPTNKKWVPSPINEKWQSGDQSLSHLKSHPLLAPYFTSIAAEIMIQLDVENDDLWNFAHITEYIIRYELGELVNPEFDTTKYYAVLKSSYDDYDDLPTSDGDKLSQ